MPGCRVASSAPVFSSSASLFRILFRIMCCRGILQKEYGMVFAVARTACTHEFRFQDVVFYLQGEAQAKLLTRT